MDNSVELSVKRIPRLFNALCRTTVKVTSEDQSLKQVFRLWNGQEKTIHIPKVQANVSISTSMILGRPVIKTVRIYSDRFDHIQVSFKPVRYNFFMACIPGLAFVTPAFEYEVKIRNYTRTGKTE